MGRLRIGVGQELRAAAKQEARLDLAPLHLTLLELFSFCSETRDFLPALDPRIGRAAWTEPCELARPHVKPRRDT